MGLWAAVITYVKGHPGSTVAEIQRGVASTKGLTTSLVKMIKTGRLTRAKGLTSNGFGKKWRYYPADSSGATENS